jgi:EAL domain-containing protein (putative c-di-GMP-specific phosphodiesterase class I)
MVESIRIYHEHLPGLTENLIKNGSLALIVLDVSPFGILEEQYGIQTYSLVRQRIFDLLTEQTGKEYRKEDILALEEPGELRFLLFLSSQRKDAPIACQNLDKLRVRLRNALIPRLLRSALPYLKNPPLIQMGSALGIHNPLIDPHHTIMRIIREALENAEWQRKAEEMRDLRGLTELIVNEQVITLYQPIVNMQDGKPMGYEALARGGPGTAFQSADELFDAAVRHHLVVELDRVCRKRALFFSDSIPPAAKIFINTLPATIRDPEFQGQHLIESLELVGVNPRRIVMEITEKLVIENLSLFQDAVTYFTDLGMSLAVDDVGTGYSGLETIAKLRPSYLKIDMSLVRDIHASKVNQEILKAIILIARGVGAKVIAEGIQVAEEFKTLQALGIDYGQGYLLGRPVLASKTSMEKHLNRPARVAKSPKPS